MKRFGSEDETFGLDYARRLQRRRARLGDMRHLDELFLNNAEGSCAESSMVAGSQVWRWATCV